MELSLVIPSRSGSKTLESCLQSCQIQTLAKAGQVEVIVVVNGGSLDSEQVSRFSEVMWLQSPKGAGKARNKGYRQAQSDRVYFLDDDCILPDKLFLERLITHSKKVPGTIIGGPYLNSKDSSLTARGYNFLANLWLHSGHVEGAFSRLLGGNFLAKKSLLGAKELFNPAIDYGASEAELFQRLYKKNTHIWLEKELGVFHKPQSSFFKALQKSFKQGQNESRYSIFLQRKSLRILMGEFFSSYRKVEGSTLEKIISVFLWGASFSGRFFKSSVQAR